jgi:SAM-dependent methyltransferase
MNPPYSTEALLTFYGTYITRYEPRGDEQRRDRRRRQKERSFELIERFVRPGNLLSIGSGDGLELSVAQARGWSVVGHDMDPRLAAEIRAASGVEVLSGPLLEHPFTDSCFDCVFMDQVLEHLTNPRDYLMLAGRVLRPGGILYLGVPNTGSIAAMWQRSMGRLGLKRKTRGRHYDTGHHVLYFTPRVAAHALERWFGFQVQLVQGDPKMGDGRGVAAGAIDRLRTRLPVLDSAMRIIARKPA